MRTSSEWVTYYEHNRENLMAVPWEDAYHLTPQERDTILSSIQQFQLGESSEGKRLNQLAATHAEKHADPAYADAVALFIREEQRHAAELARFMQHEGLPCLTQNTVDGIFRFLRRAVNLEVAISVLLTAEIIAMTYYKALHDATRSPILQTICRQILRDEVQHLSFQCDGLAKLRAGRSALGMWITHQLQRVLFVNTLFVVWIGHRKVYRAGGFPFVKFMKANYARFQHVVT